MLGRVDGFHQDEAAGESYQGGVVLDCLFAAQGDALEPLDFSNGLLDAGSALVEGSREEAGLALMLER